jgi:triosephosphate isomerase
VDQKKVAGIDTVGAQVKDDIYQQYLEAFKVGVYDYIKEEVDPTTNELIPRKYFAGGITALKEEDISASPVGTNRANDALAELKLESNTAFTVALNDEGAVIADLPDVAMTQELRERRDRQRSDVTLAPDLSGQRVASSPVSLADSLVAALGSIDPSENLHKQIKGVRERLALTEPYHILLRDSRRIIPAADLPLTVPPVFISSAGTVLLDGRQAYHLSFSYRDDASVQDLIDAISQDEFLNSIEAASSPVLNGLENISPIGVLAPWITRADRGNTGELSGRAAIRAGANGAIAGHSDARQKFGDTDQDVADQLLLMHELGMRDKIFAFGEMWSASTERQIQQGLLSLSAVQVADTIFVYDPIWVKGAARLVRKRISELYGDGVAQKIRILYGGPITPEIATTELIAQPDLDGFLVEDMSNQEDIVAIVRIVEKRGPTKGRIPYVGVNNKTNKIAIDFYEAAAKVLQNIDQTRVQVGFAPSVGLITEAANAFNEVATSSPVGGIDLDSKHMSLKVRRDGNGVPLPVSLQPVETINIRGLVPVIIHVAPVNVPLILGKTVPAENNPLADTDDGQLLGSVRNEHFDRIFAEEQPA